MARRVWIIADSEGRPLEGRNYAHDDELKAARALVDELRKAASLEKAVDIYREFYP